MNNLYYHFKKEDLKKAIDPLSGIIRDSLEFVNRTVHLRPVLGFIELRVNSNGFYYFTKIPLLNRSFVIDTCFVVDYKHLVSIVSYSEAEIKIFSKTNKLVVNILGGIDEIDCFNVSDDYFYKIDQEEPKRYKNLPVKEFKLFLDQANTLLELGLRTEDKRVYLNEEGGYSNFNSVMVMFKGLGLSGSMRLVDIKALKKLICEDLHYGKLKNRIYLKSEEFKFSYSLVRIVDLKFVECYFTGFNYNINFTVNPKQIYDILNYTNKSIGSTGYLKIVTEENKLKLRSEKRTGNVQDFLISQGVFSQQIRMGLKIKNLLFVFKLLQNLSEVKLSFDERDKMIVEGDYLKVIFGSEFEF